MQINLSSSHLNIGLRTVIGLNSSLVGIWGQTLFNGISLALPMSGNFLIISGRQRSWRRWVQSVVAIHVSDQPSPAHPLFLDTACYKHIEQSRNLIIAMRHQVKYGLYLSFSWILLSVSKQLDRISCWFIINMLSSLFIYYSSLFHHRVFQGKEWLHNWLIYVLFLISLWTSIYQFLLKYLFHSVACQILLEQV